MRGHDIVAYETFGGMPGFEWLRDNKSQTNIAFRANDPVALASAAGAGLGLAALPCLIGDAASSLTRVAGLGHGRCDMYLVSAVSLREVARVRVVANFLAALMQRHRDIILGV